MNSNDCKGENDESHCQSAIISQESENSVNPMQPDLGRKMLFRRKGKIVKESIYWKKVRLRDALQKRREAKAARAREEPKPPVQGRRIVDIALLAKHLVCSSCKQTLSLLHAVSETRKGLTSILHVRCHNNDCENVTRVPTSRHFAQNNLKSKLYAVNSDLVRGTVKAGISYNSVNKLLHCLDIPKVPWKLFQRYKHETMPQNGEVDSEQESKDNLAAKTALESAESVENTNAIQKMLDNCF